MKAARQAHTATLHKQGLVLIAGGSTASQRNRPSQSELYDPCDWREPSPANGRPETTARRLTRRHLPADRQGSGLRRFSATIPGGRGTAETLPVLARTATRSHVVQLRRAHHSVAALALQPQYSSSNNSASLLPRFSGWTLQRQPRAYATLGPGKSFVQQTFLTHRGSCGHVARGRCEEIYLTSRRKRLRSFRPAL